MPWNVLGLAVGGVILLVGIYVGAYCAMVDIDYVRRPTFLIAVPKYRAGDSMLQPVFAPIHRLDRNWRPAVWVELEIFLK